MEQSGLIRFQHNNYSFTFPSVTLARERCLGDLHEQRWFRVQGIEVLRHILCVAQDECQAVLLELKSATTVCRRKQSANVAGVKRMH